MDAAMSPQVRLQGSIQRGLQTTVQTEPFLRPLYKPILTTSLKTNLKNILSKKESKQGSPPFATLTTAPSVAAPASREAQSQNASTPHQPQQRDLPRTLLEFWDGETPFELASFSLRLTPSTD